MSNVGDIRYKFLGQVRADGNKVEAFFEKCSGNFLSDLGSSGPTVLESEDACREMVDYGMRRNATRNDEKNKEDARAALAAIDAYKRNQGARPKKPNSQRAAFGNVPPGRTLGDKVIEIPEVDHHFARPLRGKNFSGYPRGIHAPGTWINRGDPITKVELLIPRFGISIVDFFVPKVVNRIFLKSPVSGLLLDSAVGLSNTLRSVFGSPTSLLLPDDEPPPESGHYMFSELCDFCRAHREYFLPEVVDFGSGKLLTEEEFMKGLEWQENLSCKIYDAMPRYKAYIRRIRTQRPEWRPLLKHLL